MEKEVENAVSLDTGKLCTSCKEHNILEKIIRKIIRWVSNGLIGPGGSAYAETETVVIYSCGGCGQTFLPTKINKLDEHLAEHKKIILPLLEETVSELLKKSLSRYEVFEEIQVDRKKPKHVQISDKDKNLFEKDSSVQVPVERMGFQESFEHYSSWARDFDLNPYIVPTDSASKFKLVWWAKKVLKKVPLSEKEKQTELKVLKQTLRGIKAKLNANKKNKRIVVISHGDEFAATSLQQQIDKIDTKTKDVKVISEPLPEGSIMAKLVKIVDPRSVLIREFYIPENSIS